MAFQKYLVVEANAGSGKTFSLVSRYLYLLFLGYSPNKIFALTFTKKATKEMYDRVLNSLKNPLQSGEIKFIQEELNIPESDLENRAKEVLRKLLNSEIKISTIDSLAGQILRKFSHYLEILPNFQTVEKIDIERFKDTFFEVVNLKREFRENILSIEKLDPSAKLENIFNELGRWYLKEADLYKLRRELLKERVFDNTKALEEDILKLAYLISNWFLEGDIELSASGKKVLYFSNIDELFDSGKTWLSKNSLSEYQFFKKAFKNQKGDDVEKAFSQLKLLIEQLLERKNRLILQNIFSLFDLYIQEREKFIKRDGKFSFDDINHFLVKLIIDKKLDSKFIYFRLDSQVDHFLIDEFQDTSLLQYKILEPLIEDILSGGSSDEKSFFYVGDKMQSLYRFRGGFSHLFDFVQNQYSNIKRDRLPKNYRSKERIINFVNNVFRTNQSIGKEDQKGGLVNIRDLEVPIDGVLESVQNLLNLKVKPHQIAVITTKNRDVDKVAEILSSNGIDVNPDTNLTLRDQKSVKAIIQYLHYLYYAYHENANFYLKNFLAIIGRDPREIHNKLLKIDVNKNSLQSVAMEIVRHFELFDGDENLIRFLVSLETYSDIDNFIFNYKLMSGKISKNSSDGVNILTSHKSKGLEYDHVIFIDYSLSKGGGINLPKTVISYDEIEAKDIVWTIPEKDFLERYYEIKEFENRESDNDTKNTLYVALTRGKESLTILKQIKSSATDLVNIDKYKADFSEELSNLQIKNEQGKVVEIEQKQDFLKLKFVDEFYGKQREKSLEEDDILDIEFKIEDGLKSYKNISLGKAIHSTIELMENFSKESLEIAIQNSRNKFSHILEEKDFISIESRIQKLLENSFFQNLISNKKIEKEVGFFYKSKSYYIDLLLSNSEKTIICDFKSSKNIIYHEKYIEQIKNYGNILRTQIESSSVIELYLIYLYDNFTDIERVDLR
jgi:exodeoxyribonuclease V beta subunit